MGHRRRGQRPEQRVGPGRSGSELRVRLGAHVERIVPGRELDDLDEPTVRRGPRDHQPGGGEPVPVVVVDLIAVPVTLTDLGDPVHPPGHRPRSQHARVAAQTHGAAHIPLTSDHRPLVGHGGDHRMRGVRVELGRVRPHQPGHVAGRLDHHALQAQAQPQRRDRVHPRVTQRLDLPLDAADAETTRHEHAVDAIQCGCGGLHRRAGIRGHPADLHPGVHREATRAQRFGHRQVGVRQVDVLADDRDGDHLGRAVNTAQQGVPLGPVDVAKGQAQAADRIGVEPLAVQHLRNVVDRYRIRRTDHGLVVHIAHQRDLVLECVRQRAVRPGDHRIRLKADTAQCRHRVLRRLGLELAGGSQVRHQAHVHGQDVVTAYLVADLPDRLEVGQGLDVADRPAHLGDDHVHLVGGEPADPALDLVGDVRYDLHRLPEIVAPAFSGDHLRVDLAGGDVRAAVEVDVQEPFVVADVEVCLGTVIGDEDLPVLERVHRAGVDVEVGIKLLHGDP